MDVAVPGGMGTAKLTRLTSGLVLVGASCALAAMSVVARAQTTLPPVTIVAPEQRRVATPQSRPVVAPRRAAARAARSPSPAAAAPRPASTATIGALPPAYAGGQVASGQRIGLLGNRGVMDTPFSTTSITSEYIRDQQARTLGDVLASDPSVRASLPTTGFADQVSVRGFTLFGRDAALDGLAGGVPVRRFPFDSVERVELLRGPAGLLVGIPPSGSIAGTLNYVPKRATDDPITRMTAGFVSNGNLGTAIDVGRRTGDNKEWGIRVNGSFRDGDTPLPGQSDRLGNAAVGIDYRGERFRASFDAGYVNQFEQQYSQVILSVAPGAMVPPAPSPTTTLSQPWQRVAIQSAYAIARAEYDILDNTTIGVGYGQMTTRERSTQTVLTNLQSNGNVTATPAVLPYGYDNQSADVSLRTKVDTGPLTHQLALVGTALSIRDSIVNVNLLGPSAVQNIYRTFNVPEPTIGNVVSGNRTAQSTLTSVAIADVISAWNDRVQVTIGGRQQRIDINGYSPTTGAQIASFSGERFSPAYGILLKPSADISLYANMTEALLQGPTAPGGSANAGQIFAPAVATQREVGAKFSRNGFGAQIALFEIAQQANAVDPVNNRFGVIGLQRNRGAEFQVFGQLAPGVRLLGGVSLIDGRLTQTPGGLNDGRKAPGVPNVQVTFAPEIDLHGTGVTLTGRAIYTDGVFFDAGNLQPVPGWTRFDLGARYRTVVFGRPTMLRASVENILNKGYWNVAGRSLLSLGAPRTYLVSASIDF